MQYFDWDSFFKQWKTETNTANFCEDGIMCRERYYSEHYRILFVLRETNSEDGFDLRCKNSKDGKTWNNVARWTTALLDEYSIYPRDISKSIRNGQIERIAAMNIKKAGGNGSTNGIELENVIRRDHARVLTEIEQCDPHIIIACGLESAGVKSTYDLLNEYVFLSEKVNSGKLSGNSREWRYHYCGINGKSIPIIEFCHPNLRYLDDRRGHDAFKVLFEDMKSIRNGLLK